MADFGITAEWQGLLELSAAIDKAVHGSEYVARDIVAKSGAIVEREAKQNFKGSHKKGSPHVGGSFPNVVTGDLRASIYPSPVTNDGKGVWSLSIGPRKNYGRSVELGYNGTRPFPYFEPAVKSSMLQIEELHKTMWRNFFGKG